MCDTVEWRFVVPVARLEGVQLLGIMGSSSQQQVAGSTCARSLLMCGAVSGALCASTVAATVMMTYSWAAAMTLHL